jgi:hypothetical protein
MIAVENTGAALDVKRRDALAERLFQSTLATWDVATVFVGHRLGLYQALAETTSTELAEAAGLNER